MSLVSELLPAGVPQILINRERLPHKSFDIELLGNCDAIVNEICLRLADSEPSFGQIKHLSARQRFNEVLYENLRASSQPQKKKKVKLSTSTNEISAAAPIPPAERLSSLRPRSMKPTADPSSPVSSSSSKRRAFSSLKTSSTYNPDLCYVSYPPRRYVFTGAEVYFSSDDDSSADEEELSRKYTE